MKSLLLIGNAFMILLAVASFLFACILIIKSVRSQQYKDIKYTISLKKDLTVNTYLRMKLGLVVPLKFIYGHKNTGSSPCDLEKLEIDDRYLNVNSTVVMKKKEDDE